MYGMQNGLYLVGVAKQTVGCGGDSIWLDGSGAVIGGIDRLQMIFTDVSPFALMSTARIHSNLSDEGS